MISVFLSNFIIFLLYCASEAAITQIIFNHAKPLLTTLSQHFLRIGRSFCLPSHEEKHRYQVFNVSFTSAETQRPTNDKFYRLTELSIKKCNNQSNALHFSQPHSITGTTIIIHLCYLLRKCSKLINIYYIYMDVRFLRRHVFPCFEEYFKF